MYQCRSRDIVDHELFTYIIICNIPSNFPSSLLNTLYCSGPECTLIKWYKNIITPAVEISKKNLIYHTVW